ncbi:MAG: sodium:solute symporter family protein [Candidatus Sumerlaeia bacterium]
MTLIFYSAALLAIGWWFRREAADGAGFFLAGRKLGAWQVGLALGGMGFGGSAILIGSSLAYAHGLAGLWFTGSVALGFVCNGLFLARRVRASGAHSLAHFVELQYGRPARRMVSALLVVCSMAFFGIAIKGFSILLGPIAGDAWWLREGRPEVIACAVILAYTLLGGHRAIAATDYLQIALIVLALTAVLLPLGLARAPVAALPAAMLAFPFGHGAGPMFALNMVVLMGLAGVVGGDVFSKVLSAADERAASKGAVIGGLILLFLAMTVALLALCARALLPGLADPSLAIPLLARELLPAVLFELIVLALLGALLSTGDAVLLTGATVMALDVLRIDERAGRWPIRVVTAGLAIGGLMLALWLGRLLEIMRFGYTLLVSGVVMPVLITLVVGDRRRPSRAWAMGAMLAGLAGAIAWQAFRPKEIGLDPAAIGAAASALVMGIGIAMAGKGAGPR